MYLIVYVCIYNCIIIYIYYYCILYGRNYEYMMSVILYSFRTSDPARALWVCPTPRAETCR